MTTISSTFTATGESAELAISPGESLTLAISGTWVGVIELQRKIGGFAWASAARYTGNVSLSFPAGSNGGTFRLQCSAYTSGTVSYSFNDSDTNVVAGLGTVARATETTFQIDTADINGGNIDATIIGATTTAAASFSSVTMADSGNIVVNATTGTKIGTATAQKIGFWNATPVIQQASAAQAVVATSGAGSLDGSDTVDKAVLLAKIQAIEVLLNRLRLDLITVGIIKGAA